jgi:hypothetical protein
VEPETLRALRNEIGLKRLKDPSRDYLPGEVIAMIALNHVRTEYGVASKKLANYAPAVFKLCSGLHPLRIPARHLGLLGADQVALYRGGANEVVAPAYIVPIRQLVQEFVTWVLFADDSRWYRVHTPAEDRDFTESLFHHTVVNPLLRARASVQTDLLCCGHVARSHYLLLGARIGLQGV